MIELLILAAAAASWAASGARPKLPGPGAPGYVDGGAAARLAGTIPRAPLTARPRVPPPAPPAVRGQRDPVTGVVGIGFDFWPPRDPVLVGPPEGPGGPGGGEYYWNWLIGHRP